MIIDDKSDHYDRQWENHLRDQDKNEAKTQQIMDQEAREYQEQEASREDERFRRDYELIERERDGTLTPDDQQELAELEKAEPEKSRICETLCIELMRS